MYTVMKYAVMPDARIAICSQGKQISKHFGSCKSIEIITITDGTLTERQHLAVPRAYHLLVEDFAVKYKIDLVIVGCIGERAKNCFNRLGIPVMDGVYGFVDDVAVQFVSRGIACGKERCVNRCCGICAEDEERTDFRCVERA